MATKNYKIIVHFNRHRKDWTVHYRGQCIPATVVTILTPSQTVFKVNKPSNPRAWIETNGTVIVKRRRVIIKE